LSGFINLLFSPCCFLTGNPCRRCIVQYWRSNYFKIGLGGICQLGQSFNCTAIIQQNSLLSRISIMSEIRPKTENFYHAGNYDRNPPFYAIDLCMVEKVHL
jgi:hypothetical protein